MDSQQFADDIKQSSDRREGRVAMQWDLDKLKNLAHNNLIKFDMSKCNILHLGQSMSVGEEGIH